MSETTAVATVPAHIMARIAARQGAKSALLDAVASGDQFPRISIRASRFRLQDQGVETVIGTELDVIFVAVNPKVSKIWFDKAYSSDSDDKSPPACFSYDGVRPDASVLTPVMDNCAQCPKNVLGSRVTPSGKQSKECNDVRYVAVVPSADPTKVYGLTVPVSAMKAFRLYFKELSQYGLIPEEVVTTLGFDDDASFPKITFKHKGYVPEKHIKTVEAMGASLEAQQVIRVAATAAALPAPAKVAALPQKPVVQAPPPAPEVADEPVTDEEVVVAPPKAVKATPAPTPKVAAVKPATAKPVAATSEAVSALEAQLEDLFA